MSTRSELLTPVGRLVQGSLYIPQTSDAEGKPLTYRSGANQGQPRVDYFFSLAIPKGSETHWSKTEWGAKIWEAAHKGFPNGQADSPAFAWKVTDGDSTETNRAGRKPCDREGFPGSWVLHFSSGFAPSIYNEDGTQPLTQEGAVNLGDYVQVYGSVCDNDSLQQPGVFLNHQMVALAGYGKRIVLGADPKAVGFGNASLPAGASKTPLSQGFDPAPAPAAPAPAAPAPAAPAPAAPVQPHTGILTPPVPPQEPATPVARKMTEKANGISYEQYLASGWTEQQLIQHGMMVA